MLNINKTSRTICNGIWHKSQQLQFVEIRKKFLSILMEYFTPIVKCGWTKVKFGCLIPANPVRPKYKREILSWECWAPVEGVTIIIEDPRRGPKSSEDVTSLRTRINASSLSVFFNSKIRDREEGIVISSFYTLNFDYINAMNFPPRIDYCLIHV